MPHDPLNTLREFKLNSGRSGKMYSLKALEEQGFGQTSRLPVSLRVVLESVLRNCDGQRIGTDVVKALAGWKPNGERTTELPFVLARIMLQDMAGFPALNDFAAMRAEAKRQNFDPARIEPLVPVDLVVDHSIVVDVHNSTDALRRNMEIEFERNGERYTFLKWAKQAFSGIRVVPPGNGICHQVNLEYLSRGVWEKDGVFYPDSAVGTDSHTTMVNAIGVLAWGVGGIEAEAAMLGQPYYFLEPDVVGVHMTGKLNPGVTATDLVLTVTELLRKSNVVNKFVEYFGEGASTLSATDRATVANMAPDYGATCGFFAIDDKTLEYYRMTGREEHCDAIESYLKAQGMFGIPKKGEIDYSQVIEMDLSTVRPSVSGPKQPEERLNLEAIKSRFNDLFSKPLAESGYNKPAADLDKRFPVATPAIGDVGHGDIGIAAITSCTNTSNPWVLLAAGLLAKKAVEKGMKPHPRVKTSLAPGSKVVTAYLRDAGLTRTASRSSLKTSGRRPRKSSR
jgi:aconitate hydratase